MVFVFWTIFLFSVQLGISAYGLIEVRVTIFRVWISYMKRKHAYPFSLYFLFTKQMFSLIFTFTTIVFITILLFQWVKRAKLHPLALLQWQGTLLVEVTGWQSTSRNKTAAEFPRIKRTEKNPAHTCTCELVFVESCAVLEAF